MTLFKDRKVVGTFYGFAGSGLTPSAELIFLHNPAYPSSPVTGMPVLVRLDNDDEALLVRITNLAPSGSLATSIGSDYVMRNIRQAQYEIPENIRETKLIYRVQGRPLGILRQGRDGVLFVPSHRRIPPLGSPVIFAEGELFELAMNAAQGDEGVEIGFAALGEFVWGDEADGVGVPGDSRTEWIVPQAPTTMPKFDIRQLVARRSFVLAKAGYGKSNLVKLLFSELYRDGVPTSARSDGEQVPVGVLVGDLDGEYFWPSRDVPGLADVEHLRDHLVVFTDRTPPNESYGSFVAGGVKLDVREVLPSRLFPLVIPANRLNQANVTSVMALNLDQWGELVDLVEGAERSDDVKADVAKILGLGSKPTDEAIADGAFRNTRELIRALHQRDSRLLEDMLQALRDGKLCVLDLSQFRARAQSLLGILLSRIFEHNMREFTTAKADVVPVIAVIEEAQNVLGGEDNEVTRPFVEFAKEGRKFHCGIFAVTQQPGSIDSEIISQGDNFFVFHLLSRGDLTALERANPHFSEDLLSSLLNEPLVGSGLFFSLYSRKQYPIPFRPFAFDQRFRKRLGDAGPLTDIYAGRMRAAAEQRRAAAEPEKAAAVRDVAARLLADQSMVRAACSGQLKGARLQFMLREHCPPDIRASDDPDNDEGTAAFKQPSMRWAGRLLEPVMTEAFGPKGRVWTAGGKFPVMYKVDEDAWRAGRGPDAAAAGPAVISDDDWAPEPAGPPDPADGPPF